MLLTSLNLNSEIIEKIEFFEKKYKNVFDVLNKEINNQLIETDNCCRKTAQSRDLYYQISDNCEKSKQNLNKFLNEFENNSISKNEFESESRKYAELKIYSEEKRINYEQTVNLTNANWKKQFMNLPQFLQTMSSVDKDRQVLTIVTADCLETQFEGFMKVIDNQAKRIRNRFDESMVKQEVIHFGNLQQKIERLSRMNLNLQKSSNIQFDFVTFECIGKNKEGWQRRSSLLQSENDQNLSLKDKQDLEELVEDLFSSQIVKTQLKLTDLDITRLFSKEKAILEFLVKAQKILSTEKFEYVMNESKYNYIVKIMKNIIKRKVKRNLRFKCPQRRKI